jgi:hypothetical protein
VSSTATAYINRIDQTFPVKGQDNDSQGFRDNFSNIKSALTSIATEVSTFTNYAVLTNESFTNFQGNTVENVNLLNHSTTLYDNEERYDTISIDYSLGNYQKITVPQGTHQISVTNWPSAGKVGELTLEFTTLGSCTLDFIDGESLGPELNPFALTGETVYIFTLWKDGSETTYYVKNNNNSVYTAENTSTNAYFTSLYLGDLNINTERNVFTVNQSTISRLETVVTRNTGTGYIKTADLALVPHRTQVLVPSVVINVNEDAIFSGFVSGQLPGIQEGATFNLANTNTTYIVTTVTSTSLLVKNSNLTGTELGYLAAAENSIIEFTNPRFDRQDIVLTVATSYANTFTGTYTNYIGNVYADKNRLEVTYDNYGGGSDNTFVATTVENHRDVTNTATNLVSSEWVHTLLPFGSIIMWWGSKNNVPSGWAICRGQTVNTGTSLEITLPDLRNKFIVGGSDDDVASNKPASVITGTNLTTSGGWADAIVPEHTHVAGAEFVGTPLAEHTHEAIVNDPGHRHNILHYDASNNTGDNIAGGNGTSAATWITEVGYADVSVDIDPPLENPVPEGTVTVQIEDPVDAVSVTGRNIPPFVALYYIMKISGYSVV